MSDRVGSIDESVQAVLAVEARWAKAHLSMDLAVIDSILSAGYQQLATDGSIVTRDQLLASYGWGDRYWEIAASMDHDVQILDDVAIVIGTWRGKGINAGEPFDYRARFLAVYQLEAGEWKLFRDVAVALTS
ncbi:MAG: nuclear transport factor 2 family protein [Anaerolineales bacterium]